VSDVLEGFHTKDGVDCTPVPERLMVCGLPDELSETESEAIRLPLAFGEKETAIKQLLFAGRTTPLHPSDEIAKSPMLVPVMLAEIVEREAFPLFERVATAVVIPGIAWFPKLSGAGDSAASGVAPLPVKEIDWVVAGFP